MMSDAGGMYLWVTPAGGKLWRWSYRYEGKEKLMSLGKYPEITLARARELHIQARRLLFVFVVRASTSTTVRQCRSRCF
jgi:hypothetical protein